MTKVMSDELKKISVKRMISLYLDKKSLHNRETTIRAYRKVLTRFMSTPWLNGKHLDARKELQSIDLEALHKFKVYLQARGLADYTIYKYQEVIVSMIKFAHRYRYLVSPEVLEFPIPSVYYRPRAYYREVEVIKLFDSAPENYKLPFRMAAELGLRVGEIGNIKIKDIELHRDLINIPRTKNGRHHTVYLTESMKQRIRVQLESETVSPHRLLFTTKRCSQLPVNAIRYWHTNAMKASNIAHGSPHSLRHSFVTELKNIGAHEDVVKLLVNHYKRGVTEIYTHFEDKCRGVLERMTMESRRERLNDG